MKTLGKIVLLIFLLQTIVIAEALLEKNPEFTLKLESTKKELYVGEVFEVYLTFKEKKDFEAVDSEFLEPKFTGFWLKNKSKPNKGEKDNYSITTVIYTVVAQRVGTLNISQAQMKIATRVRTRDSLGASVSQVKWKTYDSNALEINAIALPKDIDLVGKFSISVISGQSEVNATEPLHVMLTVEGKGNLEDITSFKPDIEGVHTLDGNLNIKGDKLSQKIVFVSDNDFVIPPFVLKYFDLETNKIKTIQTQEIKIKVKNKKPNKELVVKEKIKEDISSDEVEQNLFSIYWAVGIYILGLVSGMLLVLSKPWKFLQRKKAISLKDPKALFIKLLPYIKDHEVENMINILEQDIYSNTKVKLDKKLLREIIEKYQLK